MDTGGLHLKMNSTIFMPKYYNNWRFWASVWIIKSYKTGKLEVSVNILVTKLSNEHLQNEDPDLQKYFFCNLKKYFFFQIKDILFQNMTNHGRPAGQLYGAAWQLQKRNQDIYKAYYMIDTVVSDLMNCRRNIDAEFSVLGNFWKIRILGILQFFQ